MLVEDVRAACVADPRNESFTLQGLGPVFQVDSAAKVLVIGQAPGRRVQESGIPFDDKSGDNLREWMGIDRAAFYSKDVAIMPMDFYFPGKGKSGDLPPRKFVAREYHPLLIDSMPNVRLTVLVGKYAIDYYLSDAKERNLTETVRNYRAYLPRYFPIVHPSPLNFRWQAKNPWFLESVVPELQRCVQTALRS